MKTINKPGLATLCITTMLCALPLAACSGQQEEGDELQTTEDDEGANQGEIAQDDAKDGNGQENYAEGEGGGGDAEANAADGAAVNSDTSQEAPPEQPADALPNNAPALEPADGGTPPPANNSAALPAPTDAPPATPPPAAAPATGGDDKAPLPGGRVRYVQASGVQVMSAPNGGTPVASLQQGDHPLTWEENGAVKLGKDMYVPAGSLSDAGVPRPYGGAGWK